MTRPIRCAVPKEASQEALQLFQSSGIPVPPEFERSRKYIIQIGDIEFMSVKPADVPSFVETGAADIGIVRKDILLEQTRRVVECLDLFTNAGRLCILGDTRASIRTDRLVVATNYPVCAERFFRLRGKNGPSFVPIHGEWELALDTGLADAAVAWVSRGEAEPAFQGKYRPLAVLFEATDRLIANRGSYMWHYDKIDSICHRIEASATAPAAAN
jgi:ATP phosphoribosyltransferase